MPHCCHPHISSTALALREQEITGYQEHLSLCLIAPHLFTSFLYHFASFTLPLGGTLQQDAKREVSSSLQASLLHCRRSTLLYRELIDQQLISSALLTPCLAGIFPS